MPNFRLNRWLCSCLSGSIFHVVASITPHNPQQKVQVLSWGSPALTLTSVYFMGLCFSCTYTQIPDTHIPWKHDTWAFLLPGKHFAPSSIWLMPICHSNLASSCECFQIYPITWRGSLFQIPCQLLYMSQFVGSLNCGRLFCWVADKWRDEGLGSTSMLFIFHISTTS